MTSRLSPVSRSVLLVLVPLLAGACQSRETPAAGTLRVAVVPKGSTHEHWLRVRAGAEKAAAELSGQGTPVEVLGKRIDVRFFPELWLVRDEITRRSRLGADGHGTAEK